VSFPVLSSESASGGAALLRIDSRVQGQRIDNFLMSRVKGVPRSHLYRVLRRGEVRVNKGRVKPSYRLQSGDLVRIPPLRVPQTVPRACPPEDRLQDLLSAVLYEDERLMAVNKPSGMAVHGGSGLHWGLIEAMRVLHPRIPDLELVHRLDRETSGCLLLSKRRSTLRDLHRLIRGMSVDKRYLALLAGHLEGRELRIEAPLRKNLLRSGERVARVDSQTGKPACTIFRAVRPLGHFTLVKAKILTGRTHQIRVHAAHIGAPVAGDSKYGDAEANKQLKAMGLNRLFLHASSMTFLPNHRERPLHLEAPLPEELQAVIDLLEHHLCVSS
jgi:23S rRNA pseudouridine955/2504/2580 synthase